MKKIITIILALILSLSAFACTPPENNNDNNAQNNPPSDPPIQKTLEEVKAEAIATFDEAIDKSFDENMFENVFADNHGNDIWKDEITRGEASFDDVKNKFKLIEKVWYHQDNLKAKWIWKEEKKRDFRKTIENCLTKEEVEAAQNEQSYGVYDSVTWLLSDQEETPFFYEFSGRVDDEDYAIELRLKDPSLSQNSLGFIPSGNPESMSWECVWDQAPRGVAESIYSNGRYLYLYALPKWKSGMYAGWGSSYSRETDYREWKSTFMDYLDEYYSGFYGFIMYKDGKIRGYTACNLWMTWTKSVTFASGQEISRDQVIELIMDARNGVDGEKKAGIVATNNSLKIYHPTWTGVKPTITQTVNNDVAVVDIVLSEYYSDYNPDVMMIASRPITVNGELMQSGKIDVNAQLTFGDSLVDSGYVAFICYDEDRSEDQLNFVQQLITVYLRRGESDSKPYYNLETECYNWPYYSDGYFDEGYLQTMIRYKGGEFSSYTGLDDFWSSLLPKYGIKY